MGRYVVQGELARGGMGVVYRAHDPELERGVALKLVRVRAQGSLRARERLLREAQALAQLSHPNVIAIHDVGTHGRDVFIAMELVDGDVAAGRGCGRRGRGARRSRCCSPPGAGSRRPTPPGWSTATSSPTT